MNIIKNTFAGIGVLAVLFVVLSITRDKDEKKIVGPIPDKQKSECVDNIKKCKDNKDALLNYKEIKDIKYKCRLAVNKASRYGDPEWSTPYFDQYRDDNNIVAFEVVELIDDTVKIKNMYGTPEKSTVYCYYRLDVHEISSLTINGASVPGK